MLLHILRKNVKKSSIIFMNTPAMQNYSSIIGKLRDFFLRKEKSLPQTMLITQNSNPAPVTLEKRRKYSASVASDDAFTNRQGCRWFTFRGILEKESLAYRHPSTNLPLSES